MTGMAGDEMIDWAVSADLVPYETALGAMEDRVAAIAAGQARELIWLLEHPPLYTAGTSARPQDLIDPGRFPVFDARRGGQYTYHGPGQRVVYVMLDLNRRGRDIRAFVTMLETWIIATLAEFGVRGERRAGRVGVWVARPEGHGAPSRAPACAPACAPAFAPREDKIAAIGVKIRKWITFHGISINVAPDLSHFDGIVPCGIAGHGVTSLAELGSPATLPDVDAALSRTFGTVFGGTSRASVAAERPARG